MRVCAGPFFFRKDIQMTATLMAHCGTNKISREELQLIPTPEGTPSHQPVSHFQMIEILLETLSFRHLSVKRDEYAVSVDGMRMFGVLDLMLEYSGVLFSIGVRNANDKSMRLGLTVGYRVFVCDNMAFKGDFTPVQHKHTKGLEVVEMISIAVDQIQRNFEPLQHQIDEWQGRVIDDDWAKLIIYKAFIEGKLDAPKALIKNVHGNYFEPEHEQFQPRTLWSLSNAFTSSFKQLKPIPQFRATARLGEFLQPL
jgi:hypothetical protein